MRLPLPDYQLMLGRAVCRIARGRPPRRDHRARPGRLVLTGIGIEAGRRRLQAPASRWSRPGTYRCADRRGRRLLPRAHRRGGRRAPGRGRTTALAVLTGDEHARCGARRASVARSCERTRGGRLDGVPTGIVRAPTTAGSGRTGLSTSSPSPDIDAIFCSRTCWRSASVIEARARGIACPETPRRGRLRRSRARARLSSRRCPPCGSTARRSAASRAAAGSSASRAAMRRTRRWTVGFSVVPRHQLTGNPGT